MSSLIKLSWEFINSKRLSCKSELFSIPNEVHIINESNKKFVLRISKSLNKKPTSTTSDPFENPKSNPLFIQSLSPTHSLLFNKFNLVDNHLIIVTNEYEDQEDDLTLNDFDAIWRCVDELNGLGFFNKGDHSGQSVRHKHLQFIPLPILDENEPIPIEELLICNRNTTQIFTSNKVPFDNYILNIPSENEHVPELLLETYSKIIDIMRKTYGNNVSFNFLLTKKWISYIPRKFSSYENISLNATGFAGSLFVKTEEQAEIVKKRGILNILSELGFKQE